ncbi:MAG: TRAP transporter substrate-binding protein [Candidatus Rokuibacteriota bacterium]
MTPTPDRTSRSPLDRRAFLKTVGAAGAAGTLGLAVPGRARAQAPEITLRFASLYPPAHSASKTATRFAELVAAGTGGKVKVDVFHNAALGSEREAAEGVRSGSIDMAYSGLTGFGSYVPEFGVLEMPFLYDSLDQVKSVSDKISPALEARMAANGLALLGYLYDGPRVTLASRALHSIDDFKGLKLRVPQIPLYVQMVQAFGATPTPVALPEVYTALQSKIVEGLEGTPTSLYVQKYHEVARHLARTDHIFFVAYIAMNAPLLAKLPRGQQDAIRAAGRDASAYNLAIAKPAVQEDFARLTAAGVKVTTPDRAPFRAAVSAMKERYAAGLGQRGLEIYNAVNAVTRG